MSHTRIVLIRHGESVAQSQGTVAGHNGCQGLTEAGRRQVRALGDRLSASGELGEVGGLYASLMARSIETADLLADVIGGLSVVRDCDFCEQHPGEMDGMSFAEADRHYPPASWEPDSRRSPGSETWREMAERVARGLDRLTQQHVGQSAVVVCHGGVVVHSMVRWLRLEPTAQFGRRARIEPVNTSITEWCVGTSTDLAEAGSVDLVRFNDHAHLM